MKILMILTSHDQLGETGNKTGFWLEEFASPYYVFKDANAEITLASPAGGQPPLDPKSDEPDFQTNATRRFKNDAEAQQALANTVKLSVSQWIKLTRKTMLFIDRFLPIIACITPALIIPIKPT